MKIHEFPVKNKGNPPHFFDFLRFALLGQAYAKWGPKSVPGGSKIDPGGSKIDPGASLEQPKTETSGEEVHRELPESVPGVVWGALGNQKGSQKGSPNHEKPPKFLKIS